MTAICGGRTLGGVAAARLRIVSDLHFAETGSRVQTLAALEPLFDGAERVVFNGDSLETRFLDLDPRAAAHKAAFDAFVAAHDDRLVLLAGNHDPDICDRRHLDLVDGAVLVTHGDTIFPRMAPWGWEARYFEREQQRRLAAIPPPERDTWETRLRVCREAVLAIRDLSPRFPGHSSHPWKRRVRFLWSIRRIDAIVQSWFQLPDRAARLAATYRPAAGVVVVGHTHFPGVWTRRGRTIVNTGSFVPPFGALAADLVDGRFEMRRLGWRRGGLRVGEVVQTVAVGPPVAAG